jgi:glucose/arabinose dehydrogenase
MRHTLLLLAGIIAANCLCSAETRKLWTSSKIKGSPEPPPEYIVEPVWPELDLERKLEIAHLPSAGRIFLVGQKGKILGLNDDPSGKPDPYDFADLATSIPNLQSVYGLTFLQHPGKLLDAYVFYTAHIPEKKENASIVARFKAKGTPPVLDPSTREDLISFGAGGHNGGHLQFGPDGMLYISVGDLDVPSPPDHKRTGQNLSDLHANILRIDVQNPPPGKPYGIPNDNPFQDIKGACPEIWAFGLRNPWKISFHPVTGDLWCGDVGWESWEMLHKIERGGNYGWSLIEGPKAINVDHNPGPGSIRQPVIAYSHYEGASITGGYVYQSGRLPGLKGAYLYGDYATGRIWAMRHDGKALQDNRKIADTRQSIVTFGQAADGEILFINWPKNQTVFRLVPNPEAGSSSDFPKLLSQTGIFENTPKEDVSPGVYEFFPKAKMWQDGARSRHYIAIPGCGAVTTRVANTFGTKLPVHEKPKDTVMAKTLYHGTRKVETQVLHFDTYWRGYTYKWNDAQTDAALVPANGEDGSVGGQPWRFHSREECMRCHGGNFSKMLAFAPGQLDHDGQLGKFVSLGIVDVKFGTAAKDFPMADPYNKEGNLETRARSWLHANCAHCHKPTGGSGVNLQLDIGTLPEKMNALGTAPTKGHFSLDNPALVQPGSPYSSALYFRAASSGIGHMPMIGCKTLDKQGLEVVHDWILSLVKEKTRAAPKLPDTPSNALHLANLLDAGKIPPAQRKKVIESAKASQSVEVQGIFQRFLDDN